MDGWIIIQGWGDGTNLGISGFQCLSTDLFANLRTRMTMVEGLNGWVSVGECDSDLYSLVVLHTISPG